MKDRFNGPTEGVKPERTPVSPGRLGQLHVRDGLAFGVAVTGSRIVHFFAFLRYPDAANAVRRFEIACW
jgi:hypothetical protein